MSNLTLVYQQHFPNTSNPNLTCDPPAHDLASVAFGCPITKAEFPGICPKTISHFQLHLAVPSPKLIFQVRVRVQCAQLPPHLPARRVRRRRLQHSPLHHRKVQVGQVSSSAVFGLKLHKSRPFGERLMFCQTKDRWHGICVPPTLYRSSRFVRIVPALSCSSLWTENGKL